MRRALKGAAIALSLSVALSILAPSGIPWCDLDWVNSSAFWSWYFNCPESAGGGSSGAGFFPQ